jgi:ADP-heptose:LPS heptosyltransferase
VVVQRALPGLGDFLCAVPALRALRWGLPAAQITLIGLPQTEALARRFGHYVDELLPFPGYPGIPEVEPDVRGLPAFFAAAQERRFDLALQLHGNGLHINAFVLLLGARATAGLYLDGQPRPDEGLFVEYDECGHEIDQLLAVTGRLGLPDRGRQLEWPVLPTDLIEFGRLFGDAPFGGDAYAVLHPGAAAGGRRWPLEGFAAVGNGLARRGLRVVVTGAPDERGLAASLAAEIGPSALDLSGATSLGALAETLRGARLVVCNDTGVSHLTAAVGAPSVVVFVGSDPGRWAPLDSTRHCALGGPSATVTPAEVLAAANALPSRSREVQRADPRPAVERGEEAPEGGGEEAPCAGCAS